MSDTMSRDEPLRDLLEERVLSYIGMVREAISQARTQKDRLDKSENALIDMAELYLRDSIYYFEKGDLATALATVSYAEGLLDSLNITGKLKIEWKRRRAKRVLVAGTFDLIHPGHIKLFEEASRHGDLYVIVSRGENAEKAKKRPVVMPDETRLFLVSSIRYVKKAVLGDRTDILKAVEEIAPELILLGPDQNVNELWLREELARRGLGNTEIIRIKERFTGLSPSSTTEIIKRILRMFCGGES